MDFIHVSLAFVFVVISAVLVTLALGIFKRLRRRKRKIYL